MKCNVNVLAYLKSFMKQKLIYVLHSTQKKKKTVSLCSYTPGSGEFPLCYKAAAVWTQVCQIETS